MGIFYMFHEQRGGSGTELYYILARVAAVEGKADMELTLSASACHIMLANFC